MTRIFVIASFVLSVGAMAACGGGDSKSPTAPTPAPAATTTSVSVSLTAAEILVGGGTQAAATATLSNGTTQSVTTGWRSDQPTVATVTASGVVTGVGNGQATIFVVHGGSQGQQVIRVYPDYGGIWTGTQTIVSCVANLDFRGFCESESSEVGQTFVIALSATQTLGTVSGVPVIGASFPAFAVPIAGDGSIEFVGRGDFGDFADDARWQVNSTVPGQITGTILEDLSLTGVAGFVRYTSNATLTRSGAVPASTRSASTIDSLRRFRRR